MWLLAYQDKSVDTICLGEKSSKFAGLGSPIFRLGGGLAESQIPNYRGRTKHSPVLLTNAIPRQTLMETA